MKIEQTTGVAGEFSVRVLHADGTEKVALPTQPNLVTDNGLRLLSLNPKTTVKNSADSNDDILTELAIGVGSGTPANTDTAFFQLLKYSDERSVQSAILEQPTKARPHFVKISQTKQFIFKNINNQNITELGLVYKYSNSTTDPNYTLYTHALLKNQQGTPTAVTVLNGEVLEITYTFNTYYDIRQQSGEFTLKTLANDGSTEKSETYQYRLRHYAHTTDYAAYGVSQTNPYPAAWAAKAGTGAFDWAQLPEVTKSMTRSEMEAVLNIFTEPGSANRQAGGYAQTSAANWSISGGQTLVEVIDRSANTQRIRITTSPYFQNYPNGIRVLIWDNSYNTTSKFKSALVVAEHTTGKGIMKTSEHKLSFEVVTTHLRYKGKP